MSYRARWIIRKKIKFELCIMVYFKNAALLERRIETIQFMLKLNAFASKYFKRGIDQ